MGSRSKSAEVITKDEDRLWRSGVLSMATPKALLCAGFFLNGKNFCLRGSEEHHRLKLSQCKREPSPPRYIFTE